MARINKVGHNGTANALLFASLQPSWMMLANASLELPGRTANIFCSTTADKRVHDHILAVDRQLVFVVETDQRSSGSKRFESGRWKRPLERVLNATID